MTVSVGDLVGTSTSFRQTIDLGDRAIELTDGYGSINFDDLKGEYERAGPICLYIGALSARARRLAEIAKGRWHQAEARVARAARSAATARGETLTVDAVKEIVRLSDEVWRAAEEAWEAQEAADSLENMKFTLSRRQALFESLTGMLMAEVGARADPWAGYQRDRAAMRAAAGVTSSAPPSSSGATPLRRPVRRRPPATAAP